MVHFSLEQAFCLVLAFAYFLCWTAPVAQKGCLVRGAECDRVTVVHVCYVDFATADHVLVVPLFFQLFQCVADLLVV